jgi:hypothetical protein
VEFYLKNQEDLAAKFQPIWWLKFGQFGGRILAHLVAKVWPIWRPNFGPFSGRIWANLAAEEQSSSFL